LRGGKGREGVEREGGKGERRGKGREGGKGGEGKGHSPPRKKFLAPPLLIYFLSHHLVSEI